MGKKPNKDTVSAALALAAATAAIGSPRQRDLRNWAQTESAKKRMIKSLGMNHVKGGKKRDP